MRGVRARRHVGIEAFRAPTWDLTSFLKSSWAYNIALDVGFASFLTPVRMYLFILSFNYLTTEWAAAGNNLDFWRETTIITRLSGSVPSTFTLHEWGQKLKFKDLGVR